jgi:hypothetical protein
MRANACSHCSGLSGSNRVRMKKSPLGAKMRHAGLAVKEMAICLKLAACGVRSRSRHLINSDAEAGRARRLRPSRYGTHGQCGARALGQCRPDMLSHTVRSLRQVFLLWENHPGVQAGLEQPVLVPIERCRPTASNRRCRAQEEHHLDSHCCVGARSLVTRQPDDAILVPLCSP